MAQRIAIFGATSGIAEATAQIWASRKGRLVLVGRDEAALVALQDRLTLAGAVADIVAADLAALDVLPEVVDRAWRVFGGLDVAFVAYGSLPRQSEAEREPGVLHDTILMNFTSPAILCDRLAEKFQAQGTGMIAVITSVAGDRGRRSNYAYGAAKGGLQRFLEGLRHRLHASNIRVLDIRPGFVSTKMTAHLRQGGPLWATPDAVAEMIVRGIDRRRDVLYTPGFWRWILLLAKALPSAIFHRTPW